MSRRSMQHLVGTVLVEENPRRIRMRSIERIDDQGTLKGRFSLVSDSSEASGMPWRPRENPYQQTQEEQDNSFWDVKPLPYEEDCGSRCRRRSCRHHRGCAKEPTQEQEPQKFFHQDTGRIPGGLYRKSDLQEQQQEEDEEVESVAQAFRASPQSVPVASVRALGEDCREHIEEEGKAAAKPRDVVTQPQAATPRRGTAGIQRVAHREDAKNGHAAEHAEVTPRQPRHAEQQSEVAEHSELSSAWNPSEANMKGDKLDEASHRASGISNFKAEGMLDENDQRGSEVVSESPALPRLLGSPRQRSESVGTSSRQASEVEPPPLRNKKSNRLQDEFEEHSEVAPSERSSQRGRASSRPAHQEHRRTSGQPHQGPVHQALPAPWPSAEGLRRLTAQGEAAQEADRQRAMAEREQAAALVEGRQQQRPSVRQDAASESSQRASEAFHRSRAESSASESDSGVSGKSGSSRRSHSSRKRSKKSKRHKKEFAPDDLEAVQERSNETASSRSSKEVPDQTLIQRNGGSDSEAEVIGAPKTLTPDATLNHTRPSGQKVREGVRKGCQLKARIDGEPDEPFGAEDASLPRDWTAEDELYHTDPNKEEPEHPPLGNPRSRTSALQPRKEALPAPPPESPMSASEVEGSECSKGTSELKRELEEVRQHEANIVEAERRASSAAAARASAEQHREALEAGRRVSSHAVATQMSQERQTRLADAATQVSQERRREASTSPMSSARQSDASFSPESRRHHGHPANQAARERQREEARRQEEIEARDAEYRARQEREAEQAEQRRRLQEPPPHWPAQLAELMSETTEVVHHGKVAVQANVANKRDCEMGHEDAADKRASGACHGGKANERGNERGNGPDAELVRPSMRAAENVEQRGSRDSRSRIRMSLSGEHEDEPGQKAAGGRGGGSRQGSHTSSATPRARKSVQFADMQQKQDVPESDLVIANLAGQALGGASTWESCGSSCGSSSSSSSRSGVQDSALQIAALAGKALGGKAQKEEGRGTVHDGKADGKADGHAKPWRRATPHPGRRGSQPGQCLDSISPQQRQEVQGEQDASESEVSSQVQPSGEVLAAEVGLPAHRRTDSRFTAPGAQDASESEVTSQVQPGGEVLAAEVGPSAYRRADCRFTAPGCPLYVGVEARPASFAAFDGSSIAQIRGAERTRVLVLLEQADSAVSAIRAERCSQAEAAALELPGLLRDLSAGFVLHMRAAAEPRGLTAIDGVPTALALLVRLVEVLDVLVAPDEDPTTLNRGRRSRGGEAAGLLSGFGERSDSAVAALGGGLGPRGFLVPCLDCLSDGRTLEKLRGVGAHDFAAELMVHAALAVRLVLSWTPPLGVPRPCDVLLAIGGHVKLLGAATGSLEELQGRLACARAASGGSARLPPGATLNFGRMALVLDALRLGLRSDTCVDKLLRGGQGSGSGPHKAGRKSGHAARDPVAPLAPVAVEALERSGAYEIYELGKDQEARNERVAVDAVATAAVRLLAVLVDLPIVAASAQPNRIAGAVKRVFEAQPLSMRLMAAVRQLVCHQHRSRGWFGDASKGFHRSLRSALAAENVPGECVHAAMRSVNEGHLEQLIVANDKPKSIKAEAAACGERCVLLAALYENVEAIAVAIHGSGAISGEDLAELRSRCDRERSEQSSNAGSEELPPARRSLRNNLENLRGKIRENCMAPYVK